MNRTSLYRSGLLLTALLFCIASPRNASAEDIGAANFGAAANGMPWAVALAITRSAPAWLAAATADRPASA